MSPVEMFAALLVGHALADYPLQGDFLARAKNASAPIPGVPFWQALSAHALIHGGAVALVTGSPTLGVLEACAHALIDHAKCRGILTFNQDQALHVFCKLAWATLFVAGVR